MFSGSHVVDAPNSVVAQILNLDERGVEFGAHHHTQSDEVEKEKRDHHTRQTAVGCVIAEQAGEQRRQREGDADPPQRSEEHTSELPSLMRISSALFCLKKKTKHIYQ